MRHVCQLRSRISPFSVCTRPPAAHRTPDPLPSRHGLVLAIQGAIPTQEQESASVGTRDAAAALMQTYFLIHLWMMRAATKRLYARLPGPFTCTCMTRSNREGTGKGSMKVSTSSKLQRRVGTTREPQGHSTACAAKSPPLPYAHQYQASRPQPPAA